MPDAYDVVVIGDGAAGENVARRATAEGLSAVVIESELVGGDGTYWACMPSKALLRPGEDLRTINQVPGARAAVNGSIDVDQALLRWGSTAANWDDKWQVQWLESVNADLIRGHTRLNGERIAEEIIQHGETNMITASKVVIIAM